MSDRTANDLAGATRMTDQMAPERVEPHIATVGPGEAVAAIVAGLHGDEPSGVRALKRLRRRLEAGDLEPTGAVTLIIANPPALESEVRYLDADLNRSFPGDPEGNREERLAVQVLEAVGDRPTVALHATQSFDEPFVFVDPSRADLYEIARALPVDHLIRTGPERIGALGEHARAVTIEAGRQGSESAVDAAETLSIAFLQLTGVLPGRTEPRRPREYVVGDPIPKPSAESYRVTATNFEPVDAGEVFAYADDRELVAEEAFHPILLSAGGYADIFGFKGRALDSSADGQ